jgi:hypothetical protein
MPEEQVDAMLASPPTAEGARAAGRTGRHPVLTLLHEVARRRSITYLSVQKGDDRVVWRRAT